jgi:hypothetical protein
MKTLKRLLLFLVIVAVATAASASPTYQECTSAISGNFNGTAIAEGDYVWFTSVFTVKGMGSSPVTVFVSHASITFTANGQNYTITVPNAVVHFLPTTTLATTNFGPLMPKFLGNGWKTALPSSGLAGNDLAAAVTFPVPAGGLPGGIQNVVWTAEFSSFTSGLSVNWQWAAAAYTSFDTDYNALGVKPVDDNKASKYQNSDHAGTPENFKDFVTGGATGGGGSNFTGSYSGTGSCALTSDGSHSFTMSDPR